MIWYVKVARLELIRIQILISLKRPSDISYSLSIRKDLFLNIRPQPRTQLRATPYLFLIRRWQEWFLNIRCRFHKFHRIWCLNLQFLFSFNQFLLNTFLISCLLFWKVNLGHHQWFLWWVVIKVQFKLNLRNGVVRLMRI